MTKMKINEAARTIEMTKMFYRAACQFGTTEYKMLQEARRDYPGFTTSIAQPKKNSKAPNEAYKGLDYKYMEKYIVAHDDEDGSIMEEYKMLRGLDEESVDACAEALSYHEMKTWFLDKFPAIREYHEKREKLLNAVAEREAKRKEALKAKKAAA